MKLFLRMLLLAICFFTPVLFHFSVMRAEVAQQLHFTTATLVTVGVGLLWTKWLLILLRRYHWIKKIAFGILSIALSCGTVTNLIPENLPVHYYSGLVLTTYFYHGTLSVVFVLATVLFPQGYHRTHSSN
jgi:hypothetical protein